MHYVQTLRCTECDRSHASDRHQTVCEDCGRPLRVEYDCEAVRAAVAPTDLHTRDWSMWRYREMLPLDLDRDPVTLGEGGTPLLDLRRLGAELGLKRLSAKDESLNPTASFKARGMSAAVTMAREFGATAVAAPSAGNAGGAMAAYGARAGLEVHMAMPLDVPMANRWESEGCGAHVTLIDGTIADCGQWIGARAKENHWYDLSTLKEPYRVEGKKTMGYELAEQLGWSLPDVILYPTGGGTGLVGMVKAFEELRALGWLRPETPPPRMVAVQSAGCAPVVHGFDQGLDDGVFPPSPHTCAAGLRVPRPIGDRWLLRDIRSTEGTAIAVTDEDLVAGTRRLARSEGMFAAPEAGALVSACEKLLATGWLSRDAHVVLFVTGSGLKYTEVWSEALASES